MGGGQLLREARRRADVTQAELAARLGVSQPVVARWEVGRGSMTLVTLTRALRACGFELETRLRRLDDGEAHDWSLVRRNLELTPRQRLDQVAAAANLVLGGRAAMAKRNG